MPVPSTSRVGEDKSYPTIPPDVYTVEITDIVEEMKPSPWKNEDGSDQPDIHQYIVKLSITDEGPYLDRWLNAWLRVSLRASTKSKRPTLPQFLHAVTGQTFGPDDRDKVTGDFINTLIGMSVRVTTQNEVSKSTGTEFASVTTFLPVKK